MSDFSTTFPAALIVAASSAANASTISTSEGDILITAGTSNYILAIAAVAPVPAAAWLSGSALDGPGQSRLRGKGA